MTGPARAAGVGGAVVAYAGVVSGVPTLAALGLLVEVAAVARVIRIRHLPPPRPRPRPRARAIGGK